jgi:hypothetical protein
MNDVWSNKTGNYSDEIFIFDYNNQTAYRYDPSTRHCERKSIGFDLNLWDAYNNVTDPSSGYVSYLGNTTLDWQNKTFDHFRLNYQVPSNSIFDFYFNTTNGNLTWASETYYN